MPTQSTETRPFIDLFVRANPDGTEERIYIHSDKAASLGTGVREAPKVSHVRFDGEKQEWYAILLDGREIARHKERDVVVRTEAAHINDMFARGEYIPGGFQGKPLYDLSGVSVPRVPNGNPTRYLGRHDSFDLYTDGAGWCWAIRNGPRVDMDEYQGLRALVQWGLNGIELFKWSIPLVQKDHMQPGERAAVNEAFRRAWIEADIMTREAKNRPQTNNATANA